MTNHQFHFGRKFYQDLKTGYWISTDYPRIRAHVWIWINNFGKISKGYHVHHIDENKSNNDIGNLQLIERSTHLSLHMQDPEKKAHASAMANKFRHLTKEWHASEEGRAWHKFHGIRTWNERSEFNIKCKVCLKEVSTKTYHQEFCSNACKSKWRRSSGIDEKDFACERCSKTFRKNRYAKRRFCGNC